MFTADSPKLIYEIEFSNPVERGLRYALLILGGILYYSFDGDPRGLVWAVMHIVTHTLLFLVSRAFLEEHSPRIDMFVLALSAASMFSFLWFPAWQVVHGDVVGVFTGAAIIICCFLYALSRNDRSPVSSTLWTVSGAVTAVYVSIEMLVHYSVSIVNFYGVVLASGAMLGYFVYSMRSAMQLRQRASLIAKRTAQEQKLASIGRLAGGVAHDFNNALTGILGNLELFHEIECDKERKELIQSAEDAANRAARLVQQLLIFSRKTGITPEVTEVRDLMEEVAQFQRRLLPANVSLEVLGDQHMSVCVDKPLMVTALINLAINAVDAMPDGGRLVLAARQDHLLEPLASVDGRMLPIGPYVRLSVEDTGTGIPRDLLPRVVEPFFSTKPVGKGSGLGLSMVVGLAQSLGGGVEIETGLRGTTVSILVPSCKETVQLSAAPDVEQPLQSAAE